MRFYYQVKKTLFENNRKVYPDNVVSTQLSAAMVPLEKSGYLQRVAVRQPTERCRWCGGSEYWLNHRRLFICKKCYPPQSFPDEEWQKVYDTYILGRG